MKLLQLHYPHVMVLTKKIADLLSFLSVTEVGFHVQGKVGTLAYLNDQVTSRISGHACEVIGKLFESGSHILIYHPTCFRKDEFF